MLGYYHMPTPSFNPDVTHIRHNVKFKIGTESFKIALRRAATNVGSMSMGCSALGVDFVINRMGLPESAYPRNFPGDLSAKVISTVDKAFGAVSLVASACRSCAWTIHQQPLMLLCVG